MDCCFVLSVLNVFFITPFWTKLGRQNRLLGTQERCGFVPRTFHKSWTVHDPSQSSILDFKIIINLFSHKFLTFYLYQWFISEEVKHEDIHWLYSSHLCTCWGKPSLMTWRHKPLSLAAAQFEGTSVTNHYFYLSA